MTTLSFGIATSPNYPYAEILRAWQNAEALGYDSAWAYDHFLGISSLDDPYLEGWTLLTSLLHRTQRIRGGTLVLGNSYRHPAVLANMATTLDLISNGRLDLGIGAGWYRAEYDAYGIPYPRDSVRIAQLDEAIQVLKALWTEERADFDGEHYRLKDAPCEPKPVQRPHPPVWIGGGGERLLLRVVARRADGWNIWMVGEDEYRHKAEVLAQHCREVGRDPGTIRRSVGFSLALAPTEAEAAQEVRRRREAAVREIRTVIAGTPEQVALKLRPYVALGADTFLIEGPAVFDREMLRLFQQQVVPALRAV